MPNFNALIKCTQIEKILFTVFTHVNYACLNKVTINCCCILKQFMRWHRSIWRKLGVMKCSLSFESRSWFVTANMFCSIGPCPFSKASLACRMCKKFAVAIANLCKTNFFSKSEKLSLQTFCVTINLPTII